ncbi:hypothetical protein FOA52_014638 [Chlamydomonas sp. UWO 241]|nr:hypothetical protein FOA52_014638 [Chlamydomonas sp. UWO 241]
MRTRRVTREEQRAATAAGAAAVLLHPTLFSVDIFPDLSESDIGSLRLASKEMRDVVDAAVTEVVARCEENVPSGPYEYHEIGWGREVRPVPTLDLRRWAGNLEELTLRFWEREWVLPLCGKRSTPLPKLQSLSVVHTESYDPDHIWCKNTWNAEVWKAPLKGLAVASQLTRLVLSSPLVVDVSFIRACKQLEVLNLSGCMELESLRPLSACTRLLELHLDGCQSVKDPACISSCVNLCELSFGRWVDDEGREAAAAAGGEWEGPLRADGCYLATLNLLTPLTQLVTLSMGCGGLASLEGLSALSQLRSLTLEVHSWHPEYDSLDLDVLTSLSGLTRLRLVGFETDLSWLPSCTSLEVLDVGDANIDSFEAVRSCSPALRQIWMTVYDPSNEDTCFDALCDMGFSPLTFGQAPDVLWKRGTDSDSEDGGSGCGSASGSDNGSSSDDDG